MKKISIILGIFLALNFGIGIADASVQWYFGSNPEADYEYYYAGPIDKFLIPATMVVTEASLPPGYFGGFSGYATRNGNTSTNDGWAMSFWNNVPIVSGADPYGTIPIGTHSWDLYDIFGSDTLHPFGPIDLPEGVYLSDKLHCYLSHEGEESHPSNNFRVTVGQGEPVVPEPATMVLFGIGTAAMAFARKKKRLA